jgi:hypothetical protein
MHTPFLLTLPDLFFYFLCQPKQLHLNNVNRNGTEDDRSSGSSGLAQKFLVALLLHTTAVGCFAHVSLVVSTVYTHVFQLIPVASAFAKPKYARF